MPDHAVNERRLHRFFCWLTSPVLCSCRCTYCAPRRDTRLEAAVSKPHWNLLPLQVQRPLDRIRYRSHQTGDWGEWKSMVTTPLPIPVWDPHSWTGHHLDRSGRKKKEAS